MSKPTTPLDSELARIFGNNTRIFRAMRELFKQAGDLSPTAIEEALITAGNAGTAANQALDVIERLTQAVELLALMPRDVDIKDDDLIPRQEFIIPDTLADLSPRLEEDPTVLKEADIGNTVQAFSADLDTYASNPLTATELDELQNINSVTITNAQWAFLGNMDQDVITTSNVTFNILILSNDLNIANNKQLNFRNAADSADLEIARVNAANQLIFGSGVATVFIRTSSTNALTFNSVQQATFTGNIIGEGNFTINSGGEVFLNLPTVSTGTSGSLWSDSGTVKVVP